MKKVLDELLYSNDKNISKIILSYLKRCPGCYLYNTMKEYTCYCDYCNEELCITCQSEFKECCNCFTRYCNDCISQVWLKCHRCYFLQKK